MSRIQISRRLAVRLTLAAYVLTLATPAPRAQTPSAPSLPPAIVVGDSLGVGMRPYLDGLLSDRAVTWDVKAGKGTAWGMGALRTRLRTVLPGAVVASLGSNDGPDPQRFADRIRRILAAVPAPACVVWPSIVRPARKGNAVGLNRVLRDVAERDHRLVVVDWEQALASGRVLLPDGLHPNAAGYAERSRMVAAAVRAGCPPNVGGVPAPDSGSLNENDQ